MSQDMLWRIVVFGTIIGLPMTAVAIKDIWREFRNARRAKRAPL